MELELHGMYLCLYFESAAFRAADLCVFWFFWYFYYYYLFVIYFVIIYLYLPFISAEPTNNEQNEAETSQKTSQFKVWFVFNLMAQRHQIIWLFDYYFIVL